MTDLPTFCHRCIEIKHVAWLFCSTCLEALCDDHVDEGCCGTAPAFVMDAETRDAALKQRPATVVAEEELSFDDDCESYFEEGELTYRTQEERDSDERDFDDPRAFIDYDLPGWVSPMEMET